MSDPAPLDPISRKSPIEPDPAAPRPASEEVRAGRGLIWKAAQLVGTKGLYLGGTLVLGYLLTPSDFGYVAIALVVTTSLMTATDTGMTPALVQAHESLDENYDVAWTIGVGRALLIFSILFFGAPLLAQLFGDAKASVPIRLMAFWPLLMALSSPRLADLIRTFRFPALAIIAIASVAAETGVAISLASRLGGNAIVLGKLAGAACACITSYFAAPYRPVIRFRYAASRQLVSFGRWLFAIGITAVAGDLFMRVLISRELGVSALGLFALADRLAEAPMQMAIEATGSIALALYSRLRADPERMAVALRAHLVGVMTFLLPATALIVALAGPLEHHVLGPAWVGASPLIIVLALAYLIELSFAAVSPLLQAQGAGRRLFGVELAQYIALVAGVGFLTAPFALMGAGIARILASIVLQVGGSRLLRESLGTALADVIRGAIVLAGAALLAGLAAWASAFFLDNLWGIVAGALLGMIIFIAGGLGVDRLRRTGIRRSLAVFFPALGPRTP